MKYFLLSDVFLSLILLFDTLNLCFNNFGLSDNSGWSETVFIFGLLAANIGVNYFLILSAHTLVGSKVKKAMKRLFCLTSLFFAAFLVFLLILYKNGILASDPAKRIAYTSITVYGFSWVVYCAVYAIRNIKSVPDIIRPLALKIASVTILLPALSLLSELIQLKFPSKFPVAFSPFSFFIINAIILLYAKDYYSKGHYSKGDFSSGNFDCMDLPADSLDAIGIKYNITEREKEILELVLAGDTNQAIGSKLFISSNTVKNHLASIFRKCEVKNRYELISKMVLFQSNFEK